MVGLNGLQAGRYLRGTKRATNDMIRTGSPKYNNNVACQKRTVTWPLYSSSCLIVLTALRFFLNTTKHFPDPALTTANTFPNPGVTTFAGKMCKKTPHWGHVNVLSRASHTQYARLSHAAQQKYIRSAHSHLEGSQQGYAPETCSHGTVVIQREYV